MNFFFGNYLQSSKHQIKTGLVKEACSENVHKRKRGSDLKFMAQVESRSPTPA